MFQTPNRENSENEPHCQHELDSIQSAVDTGLALRYIRNRMADPIDPELIRSVVDEAFKNKHLSSSGRSTPAAPTMIPRSARAAVLEDKEKLRAVKGWAIR